VTLDPPPQSSDLPRHPVPATCIGRSAKRAAATGDPHDGCAVTGALGMVVPEAPMALAIIWVRKFQSEQNCDPLRFDLSGT